ncbi:unnamed protein product [marine sediment metagenome]|uniref:Uncharacterized protein n=1 Tax=marine sediment metagenome TaxID=412755 RepID=X1V977_9ZZZZ
MIESLKKKKSSAKGESIIKQYSGEVIKIRKGANKIMDWYILIVVLVIVVVAGIIYFSIKKEKKGGNN